MGKKEQQIEEAVRWAIATAADNSHGYGNPNNQGPDYDCGSLITHALWYAGIVPEGQYYEPNDGMEATLTNNGFVMMPFNANIVKRGDILYRWGHTELAISNTQVVGAHDNYDGVTGDSSGNEINIQGIDPSAWTHLFRYGKGASGHSSGNITEPAFKRFNPRTKSPAGENNPCYNSNLYGASWDVAWNTSITGSPVIAGANVLMNCVGYAQGRALEIYCDLKNYDPSKTHTHPFVTLNCNAGEFVSRAPAAGLKVSSNPAPGAIMCWLQDGNAGHVAVVESVTDNDTVVASESGYGGICGVDWISHVRRRGSGNWDGDLFTMGGYRFAGFILNPAEGVPSEGGAVDYESYVGSDKVPDQFYRGLSAEEIEALTKKFSGYKGTVTYEEVSVTKTFSGIKEVSGDVKRVNSAKLLSYPSLVESPFVILKVGDFSFGTYTKGGDLNKIARVSYPNFIEGMQVQKVNGTVNQYTINLVYQIEAGDDPNLVDKILSRVGYGLVYISYGDWACPTFVYKEEEAIITKVDSEVDFSNSRISYKITCTSNSIALLATTFNFPERKAKPSSVIFEMLENAQYGLKTFFPGMTNLSKVRDKGLIATNDVAVELISKEGMDPVSYLNYLVSCMTSNSDATTTGLKSSTYYLTLYDDAQNELGGPYFKVTEVKAQEGKTITTADTYEVDVGFPSENEVVNFRINDNNSWALLYNYAESVDNQKYVYRLDDDGKIVTTYSPNITTSNLEFKTTEAQRSWWTSMTRFPITAELELKGLLRPSMLMSYVRINAFFYGQRHISSGLYVITKQIDNINGRGYRTLLTLLRIGGDNDYITSITKTFKSKRPTITLEKTNDFDRFAQKAKKEYKSNKEAWKGRKAEEGSTSPAPSTTSDKTEKDR